MHWLGFIKSDPPSLCPDSNLFASYSFSEACSLLFSTAVIVAKVVMVLFSNVGISQAWHGRYGTVSSPRNFFFTSSSNKYDWSISTYATWKRKMYLSYDLRSAARYSIIVGISRRLAHVYKMLESLASHTGRPSTFCSVLAISCSYEVAISQLQWRCLCRVVDPIESRPQLHWCSVECINLTQSNSSFL